MEFGQFLTFSEKAQLHLRPIFFITYLLKYCFITLYNVLSFSIVELIHV